ncbi:hypothetical protein LZ31DRAFT_321125 [Colletotrichum somersetense]|nr:hypothetical protein LZ31DRAFT_321125 [Colletotrichum somersetense]
MLPWNRIFRWASSPCYLVSAASLGINAAQTNDAASNVFPGCICCLPPLAGSASKHSKSWTHRRRGILHELPELQPPPRVQGVAADQRGPAAQDSAPVHPIAGRDHQLEERLPAHYRHSIPTGIFVSDAAVPPV